MNSSNVDNAKSFVKTMKKSSFQEMTVPAAFVRAHGQEMKEAVQVGYNGGKPWTIQVYEYPKNQYPHVAFGAGWKEFAEFHDFKEGDHLKFLLLRKSVFKVTRV